LKRKISTLLKDYSKLLELNDENQFKIKAFLNASNIVKSSNYTVKELIKQAKDKKVRGLGKETLSAVVEIFSTGEYADYNKLRSNFSEEYLEILKIKGLGAKTIKNLKLKLDVDSLEDLTRICEDGSLVQTKGFGEKKVKNISEAIRLYQSYKGKVRINRAYEIIDQINSNLEPQGELLENCEIINKLELAKVSDKKVKILNKEIDVGQTKEFKNFEVPVSITVYANEKNLAKSSIKENIKLSDIKGVLHIHTTYSDGANTLREMCVAAKEKGLEYIGISDHSKTAFYARGLRVEHIKKQQKEIKELNEELAPFHIFSSIESDILADGSLDYDDDILASFDFVIASIHSGFNIPEEQMTRRMLSALENKYTTILGHPTGRLILERPSYGVNVEKLIKRAGELGKAIELNSNPRRLELDWRDHKLAKEHKVQVPISPDAHSTEHIDYIKWGIMIANKGGLEKEDILNCKDLGSIKDYFEKNG